MKIMAITGTRADYGIYEPLLKMLNNDNSIDLQLVVTGMHVLEEYGNTLHYVEKDQYKIAASPSIIVKGDSTYAMSQMVGMGMLYFADIFQFHRPDFVLLLGDRGEMLAAAICAHYQNIGIIHLHGGEISGSADDAIRHAISKLAHIHFVATKQAKNNLLALGEESWRIFPVGSLRKVKITELKKLDATVLEKWEKKYSLQKHIPLILFVMHPDSTDDIPFNKQLNCVLKAMQALNDVQIIIIGANSDAGGERFNVRLKQFVNRYSNSQYFPTVPSMEYLYLLSKADVLVGNSSSGIIEAPFFELPTINVGHRQQNREQGGNVINVPYDESKIFNAIKKVLLGEIKITSSNPYDIVESPHKEMTKIIKTLTNDFVLRKKKFRIDATMTISETNVKGSEEHD